MPLLTELFNFPDMGYKYAAPTALQNCPPHKRRTRNITFLGGGREWIELSRLIRNFSGLPFFAFPLLFTLPERRVCGRSLRLRKNS